MREIVLDTETTGLDPLRGDRIVEIGCVELINHILTGRDWHEYINPERDMPEEAFRVHGLSEGFLSGKPVFADVVDAFVEFIADARLVIHNASFDMAFLNAELERAGRKTLPNEQAIDTLMLARRRYPGGPNSLDQLCVRYGIDNSKRTKHGALLDSELLAEVYIELLGGKQAALTLDAGPAGLGEDSAATTRARPEALGSRVTADRLEAHRTFIEGMGGKALWKLYEN